MRQAAAAEQAEQVELALGPHLVERLVVGEIDHLDDQALAQAAEMSQADCVKAAWASASISAALGACAAASAAVRASVIGALRRRTEMSGA